MDSVIDPSMKKSPKISFNFQQPLNLKSVSLNPITIIGTFQSLNQDDEIKRTRLDRIEQYYNDIQEIINSKVGSKVNGKYDVSSIETIYNLIFGKKGGRKNDNIDQIVAYYKTYVPRINNNNGSTIVDIAGGLKFSQVDVPTFSGSGILGIPGDEDNNDSEDEAEF